jgi:proteasome accessory factor C
MSRIASRLERILLMVPFMTGEEGASLSDLCLKFDVDRDVLMEDLQTLQMCGLPDYGPYDLIDYWVEGDRVHLMMADFFERPLNLTRDEALALAVAGRSLIRSGLFEDEGPLSTSLDKVESVLTEEEKDDMLDLAGRIDVEMNEYTGRWGYTIEQGLEGGRCLKIEYFSASRDELGARVVEPISLLWSRGNWYLLAWCREAEDRRLFRVDRIKSAALTDSPVSSGASSTLSVQPTVGEFKPGRKAHHVKLRFSGREGRRVVEGWPGVKVTEGEDGALTVELRTRNLEWLPNYLLKFGDRVSVLSPKELREMVRERASTLLKEYE